jgi:uncharacterized membrane protein YwaF
VNVPAHDRDAAVIFAEIAMRTKRHQVAVACVAWGFAMRAMILHCPDRKRTSLQLAEVYAGRARHGINI